LYDKNDYTLFLEFIFTKLRRCFDIIVLQKCPDGWITDDEFNMCYYMAETSGISWTEARDKCVEMDAQLMEIRDLIQNTLFSP
jgi:hypothetical protein